MEREVPSGVGSSSGCGCGCWGGMGMRGVRVVEEVVMNRARMRFARVGSGDKVWGGCSGVLSLVVVVVLVGGGRDGEEKSCRNRSGEETENIFSASIP